MMADRIEDGGLAEAGLVAFLNEAARYFEKRDDHGEDRAFWANVFNAENCRKAAAEITRLRAEVERVPKALHDEPELRSHEDYHADPVEQLAFELAAELEEAELSPNDYVTVNRDKLRQIAQRILDRRASPSALPDAWQVKVRGRWCNLPEDWSHKDCSPDVEYRPLYASPPAPAVAVPEAVLAGKIQNLLAAHLNIEDGEIMGTGPASYAIARHLAAAHEHPAAEAPFDPADMVEGRETWADTHDRIGAAVAPEPPAAEAPGQEPVAEVGLRAVMKSVADRVHASPEMKLLRSALYRAPPTYADAEAKGEE